MRALVIIVATLLAACNGGKIAELEKQTKELRAELETQKTIVDLDTQAKCSNEAQRFFTEKYLPRTKQTVILDYTNHYNSKLRKCFIKVEWNYRGSPPQERDLFKVVQIADVYENVEYGSVSEHHHSESGQMVSLDYCTVRDVECKTSSAFFQSITPLMVE